MGNDLLKQFNLILDNRSGNLYLKTNSLMTNLTESAAIVIFVRMRRKMMNRS
jgi:hypothetical protein